MTMNEDETDLQRETQFWGEIEDHESVLDAAIKRVSTDEDASRTELT